jgi:3-hydroxyacyl-CoA dehydrogenase
MKKHIEKVAVLGSGVMGSRIACHFANAGHQVVLLDINPRELNDTEKAKGLKLEDKAVKNRIVNDSLKAALTSNPSPIYRKSFATRITTGNFEDNLNLIANSDWIIEAIIENLDIKKGLYEKVDAVRKPGTIVSSNTSSIPIHLLSEGRSEDFQKNFLGTHFFNPPRYLKLLEIIPTPKTDPELTSYLMEYGDLILGKTTVECKDTPAFIANRIGVYSMMALLHAVKETGMTVEEVDKLTGPVLGRPKSATFRTADVVGLDTFVNVANFLSSTLKEDVKKDIFQLPDFLTKMIENKWLGSKTKQGFYKKVKNADGSSEILVLDLTTLEYKSKSKVNFPVLALTKPVDDLKQRMQMLAADKGKAGDFIRKNFYSLFEYSSNRVPEISDSIYKVDDALRAGFGWELGPFETWDALGLKKTIELMTKEGYKVASWIDDMVKSGAETFYKVENGVKKFYNQQTKKYESIPGTENFTLLDVIRPTKTVWSNSDASIIDLGDGIINLEFHSKMNTMGSGVIQGINQAIDLAEKDFRGLVIANEGSNFTVGANLGLILMYAADQDWDELHMAIKVFQNTVMRARYSSIPVVVAPHNMTLGGGCELTLHADAVVANAESYIGLVEFGAGVIPGGGGTKEFALRASDEFEEGGIELNILKNRFLTIGTAKVSTSAYEAFDIGILVPGRDKVNMNKHRQITEAKAEAIKLAEAGYSKPIPRTDIRVLGKQGLGMIFAGAHTMQAGHYISKHDELISQKMGYVLCGGDLSEPTMVSEQYLLDLEREAFVSLCGEQKTLERMQSLLQTGKPLRN